MAASSDVDICNRALQKLGAARITSLVEDSPAARDCNAAYDIIRRAELRKHTWSFAVERAALPALVTTPAFGYANQYQLPSDYIRLLGDDGQDATKDWRIEGGKILTDDAAPLYIRYIKNVEDTSLFDDLFVETLASKLAYELCEKITQSAQKKQQAYDDYMMAVREAKRANAIEKIAEDPPEDPWVLARV